MRFSTAILALPALAASVYAQTQDHQVMVGAGGLLAFSPSSVNASTGDTVTFVFNPKNHTVTQSSFATPCTKMEGGIASGFQPVAANATEVPSMTITVNDTTPLWFYCGQTAPVSHCGSGMVFAVNPTAAKSFEAFQQAANQTLTAANSTSSSTSSATGSTSSSTAGSSGSGSSSGSSTSGSSAATPSASTTGTTNAASGAISFGVRAGTVLSAIGIAAGILL